jgi:hypothetical protein
MSSSLPNQPSFNTGAIEQVKVMRSFYENAVISLQSELKILESDISKFESGFTYSQSETLQNHIIQAKTLESLKKDKRYYGLVLEALASGETELSDKALEEIKAQVLDEQNEVNRARVMEIQGIEIDQDVESLRTQLKPVYRVFSTLVHPDSEGVTDSSEFKKAYLSLQQYYNSDSISGVAAFQTKIIPMFINIVEAKLKSSELSSLDKADSEYYENIRVGIKTLVEQDKVEVQTSLIKSLPGGKVPDDLKTNEDLYMETIKLDETKKELQMILKLLQEGKSMIEIDEMMGNEQLVENSFQNDIDKLTEEVGVLREQVEALRQKNNQANIDRLNTLIYPTENVDSSAMTLVPKPADELQTVESGLSLENGIEQDKKDWEKARVVMDRFFTDIENGVFDISENPESDYYKTLIINDKKFNLVTNKTYGNLFMSDYVTSDSLNIRSINKFEGIILEPTGHDFKFYSNSDYYVEKEKNKDVSWDENHEKTFVEAFNECKLKLKKFGLDLDQLYGDGSTSQIESLEMAKPADNQLEKTDKWNPKNFEQTMVALQELEKTLANIPGVLDETFGNFRHITIQQKRRLPKGEDIRGIKIEFLTESDTFAGISVQTRENMDVVCETSDFYKSGSNIKNMNLDCKTFQEIFIIDFSGEKYDEFQKDTAFPQIFRTLKRELIRFGVDLDSI